jgi:uncharacterized membrane protein
MSAFVLGAVQLFAPKGTLPHRMVGTVWVVLMLVVSISAFFIHQLRTWGSWSPIHLLAIFTLVMLPLAVWLAYTHRVRQHRNTMLDLFFGALVIAGIFTFYPGRIMHPWCSAADSSCGVASNSSNRAILAPLLDRLCRASLYPTNSGTSLSEWRGSSVG